MVAPLPSILVRALRRILADTPADVVICLGAAGPCGKRWRVDELAAGQTPCCGCQVDSDEAVRGWKTGTTEAAA